MHEHADLVEWFTMAFAIFSEQADLIERFTIALSNFFIGTTGDDDDGGFPDLINSEVVMKPLFVQQSAGSGGDRAGGAKKPARRMKPNPGFFLAPVRLLHVSYRRIS